MSNFDSAALANSDGSYMYFNSPFNPCVCSGDFYLCVLAMSRDYVNIS
jgi:hypothetical protein